MEQSAAGPRQFRMIAAACVAVLLVLVGGAALAWQLRADDKSTEPRNGLAASWAEVGAPWFDGAAVHHLGRSARGFREVPSLAATKDAALILHDRSSPRYGDDGLFLAPGTGTVSALFADGRLERLESNVIGIPLADPVGRVAVWMTRSRGGEIGVTAYDTQDRAVLGKVRLPTENNPVFAIDGDDVYLDAKDGPLVWHARTDDRPRAIPGGQGREEWISDATKDHLLMLDSDKGRVLRDHDGKKVATVPGSFGTFSPDGGYFFSTEYEKSVIVWDVRHEKSRELDLPEGQRGYQARWASTGALVVSTVDDVDGWDDAMAVTNLACSLPDGTCRVLPGGPAKIFHLGMFESSSQGQFMALVDGQIS